MSIVHIDSIDALKESMTADESAGSVLAPLTARR